MSSTRNVSTALRWTNTHAQQPPKMRNSVGIQSVHDGSMASKGHCHVAGPTSSTLSAARPTRLNYYWSFEARILLERLESIPRSHPVGIGESSAISFQFLLSLKRESRSGTARRVTEGRRQRQHDHNTTTFGAEVTCLERQPGICSENINPADDRSFKIFSPDRGCTIMSLHATRVPNTR